jgi:hypothetical protein
MVIGIFPTIGVPLPFFSYGGSGLWGFTILLFIFLKMDAKKRVVTKITKHDNWLKMKHVSTFYQDFVCSHLKGLYYRNE